MKIGSCHVKGCFEMPKQKEKISLSKDTFVEMAFCDKHLDAGRELVHKCNDDLTEEIINHKKYTINQLRKLEYDCRNLPNGEK